MTEVYQGSCLCAAVRYELLDEPKAVIAIAANAVRAMAPRLRPMAACLAARFPYLAAQKTSRPIARQNRFSGSFAGIAGRRCSGNVPKAKPPDGFA